MELFNNDTNKKVVANVGGVEVLQFPYVYKDLPQLLKDITNYNDMEELAGEIEEIAKVFIDKHFENIEVIKAYFKSSQTRSNEYFYNGACLFYYDFAQTKAEKFKDTNKVLYELVAREYIQCIEDCFFIVNRTKDKLLLIDEGWRGDTKDAGIINVIDVTDCIYKEIKERTGATQATFKDYMETVKSLKELQDTLAFILWDFTDGTGVMTIKELKTAEELFS